MATTSYEQALSEIGYIDMQGYVKSPVPITFNFEPFPLFKRTPILHYWRQVNPSCQPTAVDPREIPRLIALDKQVIAVKSVNGEVIYLTSYQPKHPYLGVIAASEKEYHEIELVPSCFEEEQPWSKTVPWDTLAMMTVRRAGDFIVFVEPGCDQVRITTNRYQVIPHLQAFVIRGSASL